MSDFSQVREIRLEPDFDIIIGRASTRDPARTPSNDNLWFFNSQLSKCHAYLQNEDGKLSLYDFNSSFGTVLNNKVLKPSHVVEVKDGDVVSFIMVKSYNSIKKIFDSCNTPMIDLKTFGNPRLMMSFKIEVEKANVDYLVNFHPLEVPDAVSLDSDDESYEIEDLESDLEPQQTVEKADIYTLLEPISSDSECDDSYILSDRNDCEDQFSDENVEDDDFIEVQKTKSANCGNLDKDFEAQKSSALKEYFDYIRGTNPTLILEDEPEEESEQEIYVEEIEHDEEAEESEHDEEAESGDEVEYVCYDNDCGDNMDCQCEDESDYDLESDDSVLADYIYSRAQWMEKPPSKAKSFFKEFGKAIGYSVLTIIALGIYGGYSEANSS
ncbi:hypothetical protein CLIB1444_06S04478 [[Candida] jaroonii]|uniref:Uncharacterized protein n=1 Tax=[Candida] jaroonii TaxID=467808 RepID=A0ACA9Y931_9ASCO|nr:hypothetical protein CLIB1444_06S04478 [[Candida] jaroonii]